MRNEKLRRPAEHVADNSDLMGSGSIPISAGNANFAGDLSLVETAAETQEIRNGARGRRRETMGSPGVHVQSMAHGRTVFLKAPLCSSLSNFQLRLNLCNWILLVAASCASIQHSLSLHLLAPTRRDVILLRKLSLLKF